VTSTATATSDGSAGKVTGSTVVQNMEIAGQQVTVDASGIHASGSELTKSAPLSLPIAAINTILSELGISIAVTNTTDTVTGAAAGRILDGLQISINLDTLDTAAQKLESLFPAKYTSQLPIAIPNQQQITIDFASVQVNSTASPPYSGNSGSTGNTGSGASPSALSGTSLGSSTGSFGNTGAGSFTPTGTSGAGATTPGSTTGSGGSSPALATAAPATTPAAFKGVGSALVLLGLLAAAATAYLYKRADDASELVGPACADGDPLGERFNDTGEDPFDFGGFS